MPGGAAEATVTKDLLIGLRTEGLGGETERCLKKVPTENGCNRGKLWALQLSILAPQSGAWREGLGAFVYPLPVCWV